MTSTANRIYRLNITLNMLDRSEVEAYLAGDHAAVARCVEGAERVRETLATLERDL